MSYLEEEFQKLVKEMRERVQEKLAKGELNKYEAEDLNDMIDRRTAAPHRGWNSSGCSIGYDDSDYDDDGWSPSMVC